MARGGASAPGRPRATGAEEGVNSATAATFLAGFAASHLLSSGQTVFASAGIGLHLARVHPDGADDEVGAAPAGRLGLGVGFRRRGGMPFLEASVLAAGAARSSAFAALALSLGWRFDLENRNHGHAADRR